MFNLPFFAVTLNAELRSGKNSAMYSRMLSLMKLSRGVVSIFGRVLRVSLGCLLGVSILIRVSFFTCGSGLVLLLATSAIISAAEIFESILVGLSSKSLLGLSVGVFVVVGLLFFDSCSSEIISFSLVFSRVFESISDSYFSWLSRDSLRIFRACSFEIGLSSSIDCWISFRRRCVVFTCL